MSKNIRRFLIVALMMLALGLMPGQTAAAPMLSASIADQARLLPNGRVLITLTIACERGADVLEAFLYVSQDGVGSSGFVPIAVRCTGHSNRYVVQVRLPEDSAFQPGEANISGYVLISDPATGKTASASPFQTVVLG